MKKLTFLTLALCLVMATTSSAEVLREVWWQSLGIDDAIALVNSGTAPGQVDILEQPTWEGLGDNYVARMSGWLTVPADGEYTFYVAGDDYQRLYISQDDNPLNAGLVAFVDGWTASQEWAKYPDDQMSEPMMLTEGQVLAIYGIMQEGGGGDGQDWGWMGPGVDEIQVIPGEYLTTEHVVTAATMPGNPSPANGATGVVTANLSWTLVDPTVTAPVFDVYFGTDPEALELIAEAITETSLNVGIAGSELDFLTTYYWVVTLAGGEGQLWSFTTEPATYEVTGVVATSDAPTSASFGGPEATVDGSGLTNGVHDTQTINMWGADMLAGPVSIQYELPAVYKLVNMQVWNSNGEVESMLGFGAKDVAIEYSVDGQTWTALSDIVLPQAPAPATNDYAGTTVDLGIVAQYVKLTISSNYSMMGLPTASLSEVRFNYVPAAPRLLAPADGVTGVDPAITLSWNPGRDAASHDVYLNGELVATTEATSLPVDLAYGTYNTWKVDAVGASTGAFAEDFESYAAGSDLHGQGGWKGWYGDAGATALATDGDDPVGAGAVEILGSSDLVHEFTVDGGTIEFTAMQYIPSGTTGTQYFILLSGYDDAGADMEWSVQTTFNLETGAITSYGGTTDVTTIVYDQWVPVKCVIDLDNNTIDDYYNGILLESRSWSGSGKTTLDAIDLYGAGASSIYYDDITITKAGDVWESDTRILTTAEFGAAASDTLIYDETGNEVQVPVDLVTGAPTTLRVSYTGNPIDFAEADGDITIVAAGADIWGTADQMRYAYQSLSGDCEVIVRVDSIDNIVDTWVKAGLMIRQSTEAGATNSIIAITGGGGDGATFQWRPVADAASNSSRTLVGIAPPSYIRLVREGNTFTGYVSADGVTWEQQGDAATVEMTDPVLVGLAVTSHSSGNPVTVQFSELSATGDITGDIMVEAIGVDMPANDPAGLYVTVEDAAGASFTLPSNDPIATNATSTQTMEIPVGLLSAAGVDVTTVTNVTIGAGAPGAPAAGSGTVDVSAVVGTPFVDNIVPALVADYAMDGDLTDSTGNAPTGVMVGEGITFSDDAVSGQALSLPGGDNNYVFIGKVGILGPMPKTIACWAKADNTSIPDWTLVFGFTGKANEDGSGGNGSHFNIGSLGGPGGVGAHVWGWEETIFTDEEALEWHHYAMSYDGTTIQYYGDGVAMDTDPAKANVMDLSLCYDRVQIGSRSTQASSFPGLVDDAMVFNYTLTEAEVADLVAGK